MAPRAPEVLFATVMPLWAPGSPHGQVDKEGMVCCIHAPGWSGGTVPCTPLADGVWKGGQNVLQDEPSSGCHLSVLLLLGAHGAVKVCTLVPEEVGPQRDQAETPNRSLGFG